MDNRYIGLDVERTVKVRRLMTFFDHTYQPGYHFKGEAHNFWEFVLILDGAAGVYAGDSIFHLTKGQCVWHRPNEFHSIWTEGDLPLRLGIFSFDGDVSAYVSGKIFRAGTSLCSLFSELRQEADDIFLFEGGTEPYKDVAFSAIKPERQLALQIFVGKIEALLVQSLCRELIPETRHTPSAENYLRLISVISQNIDKRMSIPEIAAQARMSVANAKRIFAKYAGCGISEYYNSLKIEEARRLLATGNTVSETAELLGFESQSYFSSFFKRLTGNSPSGRSRSTRTFGSTEIDRKDSD